MRVHVLQHASFEDIGSIAPYLERRGAQVSYTRFYENPRLPVLDAIDMILAMGGPMSVHDENELPWLKSEKQFLREAVIRGVSVLGICLGAQLIASAMGSRVYRNPVKEVGWFPIRAVPVPDGVYRFPPESFVFHWHGETFDLPEGAVQLAKSDACENQAFQLKNVIGLQFHLETTPGSASALLEHCRDDLVPGPPYVQGESEIRAIPFASYETINSIMNDVLSHII